MKLIWTLVLLLASANVSAERSPGPGSGYADLADNIINYEYFDFGGFHVHVREQKMIWRGFVGYFKDIVSLVEPNMSKIAPDLYFVSWPTVGDNGDNVVWNFNDMTVFAHLGGGQAFKMIHGVIHCRNTQTCVAPPEEAMPPQLRRQKLAENVQALGFESPQVALAPTRDMSPADVLGMNELNGKSLSYATPEGTVTLEFTGQQIRVTSPLAEKETHNIHATRVAQDIYFVSWGGEFGGNHIVFNALTMQVFDHITTDGTRAESIYNATCLGAIGSCF